MKWTFKEEHSQGTNVNNPNVFCGFLSTRLTKCFCFCRVPMPWICKNKVEVSRQNSRKYCKFWSIFMFAQSYITYFLFVGCCGKSAQVLDPRYRQEKIPRPFRSDRYLKQEIKSLLCALLKSAVVCCISWIFSCLADSVKWNSMSLHIVRVRSSISGRYFMIKFLSLFYLQFTVAQFMYIIRKRIQLPPEKAMFLFVNKVLPTTRFVLRPFSFLLGNVFSLH